ncbi:MAG: EmrE protein [Candidatus Hydrothermia bacterium]
MGILLRILGVIGVIAGIVFAFIPGGTYNWHVMIANGIALFALGTIHDDVKEIKGKAKQ